ncbi:type II toxin-antitoxin system PemK/MazF family toxin [Cellulomonas endometrii]|uniref:type II toxin-antitoxin system PemK/MazF family toxin n=1 Tax=Cellulomonas endometrii TaxID=3036301 RepID=UPI0024ACE033|nr:type II toxin-antitoxin system PemK/MazF family toxin [Cellulomonas endometrii]
MVRTGAWRRGIGAVARVLTGRAGRPRPQAVAGGSGGGLVKGALPGDHAGPWTASYSPDLDGAPDPGEVVWTWVPYEDDPRRGKDRPVLLVGRDGRLLLGLMLTSKDHDRDAADEARHGRRWLDVGTGAWDAQRRPSEVRLDRVLRVDPARVRREGAVVDRALFDRVVAAAQAASTW